MTNTICLAEATEDNAEALSRNGNGGSLKDIADALREKNSGIPQDGGTDYLLKSFQKAEGEYPYLVSPYPIEDPIIEVLNVGDISFRMGELEGAAYCLTGSYPARTEWKKGAVFYAEGNGGGMSNISIFDANDKLIRQLEIMNYCGFYILSPDGSQTINAGCFVRDYKTANW